MIRLISIFLITTSLWGQIALEEMMTPEQMHETGIDSLNQTQKQALENWINNTCTPKESHSEEEENPLYLSMNIGQGSKIQLSDGTVYDINPEDRIYSSYWITPVPISLSKSDDPNYPVKITNANTGSSVKGKQTSTKQMLEEFREKEKEFQKKKPSSSQQEQNAPVQPGKPENQNPPSQE